jgi:hypothetical protein
VSSRSALTLLLLASYAAGFALRVGRVDVEALLAFVPLRCPMTWLSLRCPTCGLGRALGHAWTLNLERAWAYHPLGVLLLGASVLWLLLAWLRPSWLSRAAARLHLRSTSQRAAAAAAVVTYAVWGLLRAGG